MDKAIEKAIEKELETISHVRIKGWYFYRGMNPARLLCGKNDCPMSYLKRYLK